MKTLTCALLLIAAACGLATTAHAEMPFTHALVHLKNESAAKATIYYRACNDWQCHVIERGDKMWINIPYEGVSQVSPTLFIRMDVNTNRGMHVVEYSLVKGASPDPTSTKYGTHYVIRQIPGTATRFLAEDSPQAKVTVTDKNTVLPQHEGLLE